MATVGSKESTVSQLLVGFYSADRSCSPQLSATNFRQKIMRLQRRRRFHCLAPQPPDSPSSETRLWPSSNLLCSSWLSLQRAHLIKAEPFAQSRAETPGRGHTGSLHYDWQGWQWTQVCWLALHLPLHWGLIGKASGRPQPSERPFQPGRTQC